MDTTGDMQMSNYLEMIKRYEGCSLKAYLCPAHKWTIGYGITVYPDGTPVKEGDIITQSKADALLLDYIINQILPHIRDLSLSNNQEKALVSLLFNVGWPAFSKSKCYKAIKERDWGTAYKNWDWITGGGKVLNGLIKRREEERFLFFMDI